MDAIFYLITFLYVMCSIIFLVQHIIAIQDKNLDQFINLPDDKWQIVRGKLLDVVNYPTPTLFYFALPALFIVKPMLETHYTDLVNQVTKIRQLTN